MMGTLPYMTHVCVHGALCAVVGMLMMALERGRAGWALALLWARACLPTGPETDPHPPPPAAGPIAYVPLRRDTPTLYASGSMFSHYG
jgi:hypothetical protein